MTLLPEIENVLLDAIARDHTLTRTARRRLGARLSWPRRGRTLALIAVLVVAGANGALAAAGVYSTNRAPVVATPVPRPAALRFSACMRAHGLPNFPNPGTKIPLATIAPRSSQFQRASHACVSELSPQRSDGRSK